MSGEALAEPTTMEDSSMGQNERNETDSNLATQKAKIEKNDTSSNANEVRLMQ